MSPLFSKSIIEHKNTAFICPCSLKSVAESKDTQGTLRDLHFFSKVLFLLFVSVSCPALVQIVPTGTRSGRTWIEDFIPNHNDPRKHPPSLTSTRRSRLRKKKGGSQSRHTLPESEFLFFTRFAQLEENKVAPSCMHGGSPSWSSREQHVRLHAAPPAATWNIDFSWSSCWASLDQGSPPQLKQSPLIFTGATLPPSLQHVPNTRCQNRHSHHDSACQTFSDEHNQSD